ncbi:MAG: aminopeptidase P N-terminal domain-containing protein, partial [Phycisphaeraceae bacterium]|nr:aminopeptidase P N-terminal domain-containing protein [Phycisphaeraceae bacterium]
MFAPETYGLRREGLFDQLKDGLVLLLGNHDCPMNYTANILPFRQDSTFLYYVGLDEPGLAAVLDVEARSTCVFGHDMTVEESVWTGSQPLLKDKALASGVTQTARPEDLASVVQKAVAAGRQIHVLPQYRSKNRLTLQSLLGQEPSPSEPLIRAVAAQRSVKSSEEIEEIERALSLSYQMHTTAMQLARPGKVEREIVGYIEGMVKSQGMSLAFPTIFSVRGEILHNPTHNNVMQAEDIVVYDSGAESPLHYASDISRTIPVSGRFTPRQRDVYEIVLKAQGKAIEGVAPGVEFRSLHRLAAIEIVSGLKDLGVLTGDVEEAVAADVHTLFFQCGLGHMMGLDVHDMENLGEEYVGYTDTLKKNPVFGWQSLRLGKALESDYVVTVEPGIYFIPDLIDQWRSENKLSQFINYEALEAYRKFGGMRVEDDILVTPQGYRLLGQPIP